MPTEVRDVVSLVSKFLLAKTPVLKLLVLVLLLLGKLLLHHSVFEHGLLLLLHEHVAFQRKLVSRTKSTACFQG